MNQISTRRRPRWHARLLAGTCAAALPVLTACTGAADGSDSGSGYRVAVLSVGTKTDGSFGQVWAEASAAAAVETTARVQWAGSLDTPNQYLAQGSSFATAGFDLVVLAHGGMTPVGVQLAQRFPNTRFCVAPVPEPPAGATPPNLCVFDAKQEIGAFRAGLLAGLATRTNVVAANQSLPIPAITRQTEAYRLGAECVNSKVTVLSVVTNSDTDPSVTRTATESQLRENADVVMGATGTAMTGMFEAAKQKPGTYAIGQYVDASAVGPETVLASNIVNFQEVFPRVVADAMRGPLPAFHAYGLDAGVPVGYLAMNEHLYATLPADVRAANDRVQQRLTNGEITLPKTGDIDTVGDAQKIDVTTLGCQPS